MQIDSCGQKAGLAIALVASLVGIGCAGYGTGSSKAAALNTYAYVTQQNTSIGDRNRTALICA